DEPEDLRRLLANVLHVEVELPRPARALTAYFPERVARLIDGFQGLLERRIHLAAFDKPSAHLVDDRDVFDPYRADLDASHALHAGPERLRPDDVADDVLFRTVQRFEVQLVPDPERTLGDLAQVQDQIAGRKRIAGVRRGAGSVALAALRAGVELEEIARREVENGAVPDLSRLRIRRNRWQLSSRPIVAQRDARRTREHVHRLRERNGSNEAERCDAVHPPLDEVCVGGRVSGDTEPAEGFCDGPTERRPNLERRVRLGNTERLEQESRQGEEEQDAKEGPVTDHVQTTAVLAFGPIRAPVTQPKRSLNSALVGHDRQPGDQGGAEDVEKERVPLVELVPEEIPAQDRLCEVVLEAEDGGPDEEDEKSVEDQEVPCTRDRVTPLDPGVCEDDPCGAPKTAKRPVDAQGPPSAAVLEHEAHDAP